MTLSTEERLLIETRVGNERKSTGAAYLLWIFTWFVSGHRFYLGRPGTAILQILSYFVIIGFIWWIVDAFLIPGMIKEDQDELRRKFEAEARGGVLPSDGAYHGDTSQWTPSERAENQRRLAAERQEPRLS